MKNGITFIALLLAMFQTNGFSEEFSELDEFVELEEELFVEAEEEPIEEFFYEDLIVDQENRKELIDYIQLFSEEEYPVAQTDRGSFYFGGQGDQHAFLEQGLDAILEEFVTPETTVVDYGAGIGLNTLTLSQLVGNWGNVVAIESCQVHFRQLFWNMVLNGVQNVSLMCGQLNELQTLDALQLKDVSLIKVDAKGHEDLFLLGARKTIAENRPVLLINILGGIPLDRTDKFIKHEYHQRLEKLKGMGYTTRVIIDTFILALPITNRR